MLDTSADAILEVFAQALETTAFVTLEPAPADTPCPDQALRFTMTYADGARLSMTAPRAFGAYLAANTLAVTPDDPLAAANAEDALREILNVASGLYLTRITGPDAELPEMGLPTVLPLTDGNWDCFAHSPQAVMVLADGFPLLLQLEAKQ